MDASVGTVLEVAFFITIVLFVLLVITIYLQKHVTRNLFFNFIKILGTGMVCSMFPFGPVGLALGFTSVFLASILLTLMLKSQLS